MHTLHCFIIAGFFIRLHTSLLDIYVHFASTAETRKRM